MVAVKQKFQYITDGSIDTHSWLQSATATYHLNNIDLLTKATHLAETSSKGLTTFYGQPCIEQGIEMTEIILDLKLDQEAAAAAMIVSTAQHTRLSIETITEILGENVAQLVSSFLQTSVINNLLNINKTRDQTQIDRLRKTLLSMVSDIRVVLIKLAERTCIMRGIKKININERKHIAQETMDLYAPLANRLGIGQLKWELEDTAFHYTNPDAYKKIATFLAERRTDREMRINSIIAKLKEQLELAHIKASLSGRAKHIYSIYLKMQKKDLDYKNIYDYSAVRILVPTISDCYTALSIVHTLWEHIPDEFDDYISKPKPNGYRSIHTAVIGPDGKNLEIQIRSEDMHQQAEHGVAAHWIYKEDKPQPSGYETKITYLRQLLAWHKEVAAHNEMPNKQQTTFLEDRVYVFTPAGDVIDLPIHSTPLDFAYQVHSSVGHRCRGAKINGHIVPLTYKLQTGDQVEIITTQQEAPSRDWLNKELGFITSARARAKIANWFKHQDINDHIESGKHAFERELGRAGLSQINLQKVAARFNYKHEDMLFAAIGRGVLKAAQVIHTLQTEQKHDADQPLFTPAYDKKRPAPPSGIHIAGADDFLTRIARCCKPIPGDQVIGFITQGRGVSIHRANCGNIIGLNAHTQHRLIDVSWDKKQQGSYYVDLQIRIHGSDNILKEIASLLANIKISLIALSSTTSKKNNMVYTNMTIQISELNQLKSIMNQLLNLPNVVDVQRMK